MRHLLMGSSTADGRRDGLHKAVRFVACPQVIHCGEKATLTWNVRKACVGVRACLSSNEARRTFD
jgi:hypothetical protein